jgi:L-threonylcarbamoyladenylate synthase
VREEFGDGVRVILDGGESKLGLESTIVACVDGTVRLLRPGSISLSELRRVVPEVQSGPGGAQAPRAPGSQSAHYAPSTPLAIASGDEIEDLAAVLSAPGNRIAVLAQRAPLRAHQFVTWINAGVRPDAYAHDLYAHLRALDRSGCARILVQQVPAEERWDAVRDRLTRAAAAGLVERQQDDDSLAVGVLP